MKSPQFLNVNNYFLKHCVNRTISLYPDQGTLAKIGGAGMAVNGDCEIQISKLKKLGLRVGRQEQQVPFPYSHKGGPSSLQSLD